MANLDLLNILKSQQMDPAKFQYDLIQIPPMYYYLSNDDIEELRKIATSLKLSSKMDLKLQMIDNIMRRRGFKKFQAGTNRVIYKYEEDTSFVVKVAIDRVGMSDNPAEYNNQHYLKPFCSKTFYISPCGTVAFAERVEPITRAAEFENVGEDVYTLLTNKILGRFVMEDIGSNYFMNYGIRKGFGIVILDYTYLYELDGNKLFCNSQDPDTGITCDGIIDYDQQFNSLVCDKCGKRYLARDLKRDIEENKIIMNYGGRYPMKVQVMRGDKVISESEQVSNTIIKPRTVNKYKNKVEEVEGVILNYRPQNFDYTKPAEVKVVDEKENYKGIIVDIKTSDDSINTENTNNNVENIYGVYITGMEESVNSKPNEMEKIPEGNKENIIETDKEEAIKKEEISNNEIKVLENKPRKVLINTKLKMTPIEMNINKKICSGEYYFDDNGKLLKNDGTPVKAKNLRLKAKDYVDESKATIAKGDFEDF